MIKTNALRLAAARLSHFPASFPWLVSRERGGSTIVTLAKLYQQERKGVWSWSLSTSPTGLSWPSIVQGLKTWKVQPLITLTKKSPEGLF